MLSFRIALAAYVVGLLSAVGLEADAQFVIVENPRACVTPLPVGLVSCPSLPNLYCSSAPCTVDPLTGGCLPNIGNPTEWIYESDATVLDYPEVGPGEFGYGVYAAYIICSASRDCRCMQLSPGVKRCTPEAFVVYNVIADYTIDEEVQCTSQVILPLP